MKYSMNTQWRGGWGITDWLSLIPVSEKGLSTSLRDSTELPTEGIKNAFQSPSRSAGLGREKMWKKVVWIT